ncbi:MAG: hypothetical protein K9L68_03990 [Spirochaetales bacterium]|nr:hypothetical protein [Spirochaetales bacterium]MCF7937738.1 hypothetical protein [Spirochaetales bacterium]
MKRIARLRSLGLLGLFLGLLIIGSCTTNRESPVSSLNEGASVKNTSGISTTENVVKKGSAFGLLQKGLSYQNEQIERFEKSLKNNMKLRSSLPQWVEDNAFDTADTVSAAWWEFSEENATDALQNAIDSGAGVVIVPNMGTPWYIDPIYLQSNQEIIFEQGTVVMARAGGFLEREARLFRAQGVKNLVLRGYDAKLKMRKREYRKPPYEISEFRHALSLHGVKNVKILGLTIASSGGDGIYVGSGKQGYCENVHIRDVVCNDHYRQGISVINVENLFIENSTLKNTSGTLPQAGIDFEPNHWPERLDYCLMRNVDIRDNMGHGLLIFLHTRWEKSDPISIVIENSKMQNNQLFPVWIGGLQNGASGNVIFAANRMSSFPVTSEDDDFSVDFLSAPVQNIPPVANPGGPYSIDLREPDMTIQLDGSSSHDPDNVGGIIEWAWDLDNDDTYTDARWDKPVIHRSELMEYVAANSLEDSSRIVLPVSLRVLDDDYTWSQPMQTEIAISGMQD